MERDLLLKKQVEELFIKNGASTENPSVLAAMITAASHMATITKMCNKKIPITEEIVQEQLLDLYDKSNDELVTDYLFMPSDFAMGVIGYRVKYDNISNASTSYMEDKEHYDALYNSMIARKQIKDEEKGKQV